MDEETKIEVKFLAFYREILENPNLSEDEIQAMRFNVIKVAETLLDFLQTNHCKPL